MRTWIVLAIGAAIGLTLLGASIWGTGSGFTPHLHPGVYVSP